MNGNFIKAVDEYTTLEKSVSSYYIRKSFELDFLPENVSVKICTPGFYMLYVNGVEITKGFLAPYISNPDHIVCYDEYDLSSYIKKGKNAIGFVLGNGFANQTVEHWEFANATFRAPLCAMVNFVASSGDEIYEFSSDESFRCHPSPIIYDMYRYGTHYDANLEVDDWSCADFDDSSWDFVKTAQAPCGEIVKCTAMPVTAQYVLQPLSVEYQSDFCYLKTAYTDGDDIEFTRIKDGYLYDFGKTVAGVCRLKITGEKGQKVRIRHAERLSDDGKFNINSIYTFNDDYEKYIHLFQMDEYTLKGGEEEIFVPPFTYHGFRYAFVEGISKEQATKDLLTAVVFNSNHKQRAYFECSDEIVNKLYDMAILADNSNFHYFPTDCPQREKNGWTGDISASAEQYSMFFECEKSLALWMKSVQRSQKPDGMLPGIVPTSTWGYAWGNGPSWDGVCVNVPYYSYKYNGNIDILKDNAALIYNYLKYISTRRDENGLIAVGLGDWCQPGSGNVNIDAPLSLTDTGMVYDITRKASYIFGVLNLVKEKQFADEFATQLRSDIRKNLIDFSTMTAAGACQTSQAFLLSIGIFEDDEYDIAYSRLIDLIHEKNDHVFCGIVGLRHIFEVLCFGGDVDLALKIMCRFDEPSFGSMIKRGATALCESLDENGVQESSNHHFYGDIIRVFASDIAGLKINPNMNDINEIEVSPVFPENFDYAKASYVTSKGKIEVLWKKKNDEKIVEVYVPNGIHGVFKHGMLTKTLYSGKNEFVI